MSLGSKFESLKNPFERLPACLNFTLVAEDFLMKVSCRKLFWWAMAVSQTAENHENEWALPDIHDGGYKHQFQTGPTHKCQ